LRCDEREEQSVLPIRDHGDRQTTIFDGNIIRKTVKQKLLFPKRKPEKGENGKHLLSLFFD